jgi:polysaccharide pyruvyl transferase CsaB
LKILISGYYGFDNLGDELILASLINDIRQCFSNAQIVVLSASTEDTSHRFQVKAVNRWSPIIVLKEFLNTDLFVLGGGGLFQNKTSNLSLAYYLSLVFLARLFGASVFLYAMGVETIKGNVFKKVVKWLLLSDKVRITVRDNDSRKILESLGIPGQKITLTADPVFSFSKFEDRSQKLIKKNLLFIPRFPCPVSGLELYSEILGFLSAKSTISISVLLFQPTVESKILENSNLLKSPNINYLQETQNGKLPDWHGYDAIISARLHGLILASIMNIPFIGVGDGEKTGRFCRDMSMPFLPWGVDSPVVLKEIQSLLNNKPIDLTQKISGLRALAQKTQQELITFASNSLYVRSEG